jgi:hypothetical protein
MNQDPIAQNDMNNAVKSMEAFDRAVKADNNLAMLYYHGASEAYTSLLDPNKTEGEKEKIRQLAQLSMIEGNKAEKNMNSEPSNTSTTMKSLLGTTPKAINSGYDR